METQYEQNLESLEHPVVVAIQTGFSHFLYHWHDDIELICVIRGTAIVGVEGRQMELCAGESAFIAGGETHTVYSTDPDCRRFAIKIGLPVLRVHPRDNLAWTHKIDPFSRNWRDGAAEFFEDMMKKIYREYMDKQPGYLHAVNGYIQMLASYACRYLQTDILPEAGGQRYHSNLRAALSYISEHFDENITLDICAGAIGFNPNYFSRFFRRHTGVTFHTYVTELRLRKAENSLLSSDEAIGVIAESAGFQSIKTFNRVFNEKWKMSPTLFRQTYHGMTFENTIQVSEDEPIA